MQVELDLVPGRRDASTDAMDIPSSNSPPEAVAPEVVSDRSAPKPRPVDTSGVLYSVDESPPWYLAIFLALQHYLTFFSSAVSLPFLIAPAICLSVDHPARAALTATMLVVFGLVTLLQTTFGIRLPIVQGGSFAYLVPAFAIMNLPQWQCPSSQNHTWTVDTATNNSDYDEVWRSRMRELQGDIAIASVLQVAIGMTGAIGFLLRWITPLVITPTITLIGLSLFVQAANLASKNWAISAGSMAFMILFSQYLRNFQITIPFYKWNKGFQHVRYPLFSLLPVLLSIAIMWTVCWILTVTGMLDAKDPARTDRSSQMIADSPWISLAYPFQWGLPTASVTGVIGMTSAVVASVIESVGDYYACARLSDAPPPPKHAINRGIAVEGFGGILAGMWGTGVGATSLSQNVGAISLTKVASRRVIQYSALMMVALGSLTKFGAVFVTIPEPVVGGVYCIMFGIITAVGVSSVQHVDLNSSRNLFVLGFSLFFGMALPFWMTRNQDAIHTGFDTVDQVLTVLLSTNMLVGGILGFVLDNTIPGTDEERGLLAWRHLSLPDDVITNGDRKSENSVRSSTYDFPCGMSCVRRFSWTSLLPFCPTYRGDLRRDDNS